MLPGRNNGLADVDLRAPIDWFIAPAACFFCEISGCAKIAATRRWRATEMLKGFLHIASSAYQQIFKEPKRRRDYTQRTSPFIHLTPDGLYFELQPNEYIDRHIAIWGVYERRFLEYIDALLRPNAVMLDIGANIGNHAIFLSKRCRVVHCFEPNPTAVRRLKRNIMLNRLQNVIVHEFALAKEDTKRPFVECSGNLGASHFAEPDEIPSSVLELREASGAVASLHLDRIDYIKIDVEGMEEEVLTALRSVIEKYRPIVSFEHHEHKVAAGTFDRIRSLLDNYKLIEPVFAPEQSIRQRITWNLTNNGGPLIREMSTPERRSYDNIVAIPR